MPDRVTLDDVALKSGVSRATASRALNGRGGVRDDVRERVEIVSNALGYRPNRSAKSLAGGRTSVVGFVLGSGELTADPYATALVQEFARAADRLDEGLMLLTDSTEPNVAVRKLISDGLVDGVLISAVAIGERWIEELLDAKVHTVLVGAHPRRSDVHVVDTENRESSASMVGAMLDAGCERLITITGPLDRVDAKQRLEGFRLAHERRGLAVDDDQILVGDFRRRTGHDLSDAVLASAPDGVFASNDEMAIGLYRGLIERGLSIPDDMMLAGFDGTASERDGLLLATVRQRFDRLAMTAMETLISLVEGASAPLEQLVEPDIHVAATLRKDLLRAETTEPVVGGASDRPTHRLSNVNEKH